MIKADRDFSTQSGEGENALPARLEGVLESVAAALDELEEVVAAVPTALTCLSPVDMLEMVQRLEEILARLVHLESDRMNISAQLDASSFGGRSSSLEMVPLITNYSGSAGMQPIYHRLLQTMRGIVWHNEANGLLVNGLIRVSEAAILKLIQLQDSETRGHVTTPGNGIPWKSSLAVDVQA